jgi:hypothetical protein
LIAESPTLVNDVVRQLSVKAREVHLIHDHGCIDYETRGSVHWQCVYPHIAARIPKDERPEKGIHGMWTGLDRVLKRYRRIPDAVVAWQCQWPLWGRFHLIHQD